MTHDELLARIDGFSCCSGAHELALRAVVELHKPFADNTCRACPSTAYLEYDPYPCPTIEVIEEQLL